MSITDELRELAHMFSNVWLDKDGSVTYTTGTFAPSMESVNFEKHINHIADRIDAEHQKELQNARARGFDDGFAAADDWYLDHDEDLEEHGWVQLPKDADGEYIHFGDVLDQFGTPMTVFAMSDPDPGQGDCMLELIIDEISDGTWVRARKMRHYHAPTVEDVLREFAYGLGVPVADSYVAACAAKLQLAGDAE